VSTFRNLIEDGNSRLQRSFLDFSKAWRESGDSWQDNRRNQFESRHLSTIGPSLQRLSSSLRLLADSIAKAEKELNDENRLQ
jgi:hypothetical protein